MRFAGAVLAVFGGVLLAIVGTNLALDIDSRFAGHYRSEHQVALLLANGQNAAGNVSINIPAMRRLVLTRLEHAPEVVVLGSSRVMEITQDMVAGRLVNLSVDSGGLVEGVAIVAALERQGLRPRTVIVGVDPWMFNRQADLPVTLRPYRDDLGTDFAHELLKRMQIDWYKPVDLWKSAFSLARLREGLISAKTATSPCGEFRAVDDSPSECSVWRADGSYQYPRRVAERSPDEVEAAVALAVSQRGRMHAFTGYDRLDSDYEDAFSAFLDALIARTIDVIIYLPPYHPLVEKAFAVRRDWTLVAQAEQFVRQAAAERDLVILGAYSAGVAGCRADQFYDGIHPKRDCVVASLHGLPAAHKTARQATRLP